MVTHRTTSWTHGIWGWGSQSSAISFPDNNPKEQTYSFIFPLEMELLTNVLLKFELVTMLDQGKLTEQPVSVLVAVTGGPISRHHTLPSGWKAAWKELCFAHGKAGTPRKGHLPGIKSTGSLLCFLPPAPASGA